MTPYVGCGRARDLLEGLVDGELSMPDQLAVESHLRWCDTCALRVTDMRLIGESLRALSTTRPGEDVATARLTVLNEGLLLRVRAERDQSLASRLREMFIDRRWLWPALGATAAVLLCVAATVSVMHASASRLPDSLAVVISALGTPGSERNPLRPADNGISIPILTEDEGERAGGRLEQLPVQDALYVFGAVVSRDGSIASFEMLSSDEKGANGDPDAQGHAIADAVRTARFMPAQTPLGRAVAVDMVWLFAKTTVVMPLETPRSRPTPSDTRAKDQPKPVAPGQPGVPVSGSATPRRSATA